VCLVHQHLPSASSHAAGAPGTISDEWRSEEESMGEGRMWMESRMDRGVNDSSTLCSPTLALPVMTLRIATGISPG
jgi:hypothetical protein